MPPFIRKVKSLPNFPTPVLNTPVMNFQRQQLYHYDFIIAMIDRLIEILIEEFRN